MSDTLTRRSADTAVSPLGNLINLVMIPLSLLLVVLVLVDVHGDLRLWLTVAVAVLGPGSGLIQLFRLPNAATQLGVLMGLSAAIDILLGYGLLLIHNVSGDAAVCLLAGITCIRPLRLTANPRLRSGVVQRFSAAAKATVIAETTADESTVTDRGETP